MVDHFINTFVDNRWNYFRRILTDLARNYLTEEFGFVRSIEPMNKPEAVYRKVNRGSGGPPPGGDWLDHITIVKK